MMIIAGTHLFQWVHSVLKNPTGGSSAQSSGRPASTSAHAETSSNAMNLTTGGISPEMQPGGPPHATDLSLGE